MVLYDIQEYVISYYNILVCSLHDVEYWNPPRTSKANVLKHVFRSHVDRSFLYDRDEMPLAPCGK